ncbi:hypothetical protein [Imperialibacter roseus]|uniref:Uncharacterized protein n=1 Tax=Imperialibacter roseus TaxID=1324217 RepID=A0ABZ0IJV1_9BACT|nr:hypothetical protein [Imperialibacter roseus]WOK04439.1 hypothetical protein RT717_15265 [Imperialibacter roseus]
MNTTYEELIAGQQVIDEMKEALSKLVNNPSMLPPTITLVPCLKTSDFLLRMAKTPTTFVVKAPYE